jgi:hypothetical protein
MDEKSQEKRLLSPWINFCFIYGDLIVIPILFLIISGKGCSFIEMYNFLEMFLNGSRLRELKCQI